MVVSITFGEVYMVDRKTKIKLSEEGKKEQKKFFRLCSSLDRKKLTGKEKMTVWDFQRIVFLLEHLELKDMKCMLKESLKNSFLNIQIYRRGLMKGTILLEMRWNKLK